MTCTLMVTGHRPPRIGGWKTPNPTEQWVRTNIRAILTAMKAKHPDLIGISGMALGVDQIFAEECIRVGVPFIAAIPFEGQEQRWPEESQLQFYTIINRAMKVVIVDQIPEYSVENPKAKFILRDKWMVDHADRALVVWDGIEAGGAWITKQALDKKGTKYIHLNPTTQTLSPAA